MMWHNVAIDDETPWFESALTIFGMHDVTFEITFTSSFVWYEALGMVFFYSLVTHFLSPR